MAARWHTTIQPLASLGILQPSGQRCGEQPRCWSREEDLTAAVSLYSRSTVLQQQFNRVGKAELGSVALPAIMRTGAGGPENFQVGTMPQAQLQITSGQMHRGHMPPLVGASRVAKGFMQTHPSGLALACQGEQGLCSQHLPRALSQAAPSLCSCLADFSTTGTNRYHQLQHASCECSPGHTG